MHVCGDSMKNTGICHHSCYHRGFYISMLHQDIDETL